MRAVCKHPKGYVFESLPLAQEIGQRVVANLMDVLAVNKADFPKMGAKMITSPPIATAGSSLYIALAAVQSSSYIAGAQDNTCWKGLSHQRICRLAEKSAAAFQASCTSPIKIPVRSCPSTPKAPSVRDRQFQAACGSMDHLSPDRGLP